MYSPRTIFFNNNLEAVQDKYEISSFIYIVNLVVEEEKGLLTFCATTSSGLTKVCLAKYEIIRYHDQEITVRT